MRRLEMFDDLIARAVSPSDAAVEPGGADHGAVPSHTIANSVCQLDAASCSESHSFTLAEISPEQRTGGRSPLWLLASGGDST
jgi:hypothetical protein